MRITKESLKQIIKEELEATLLEGYISDPEEQKQRAKKFYQQIERLLYDYGQEFRSPNQIADAIMYAASKKGVKELGEPGTPSKENKFDGTRGAATALNNFMENQDPIYAWGSGNQRRSYLHAADCARIMQKVLENKKPNITVNIGTEETISVKELVTKICNLSSKKTQIIFDTSKPEGRFVKSSDTSRLKKITGEDIVKINIDQGIARMIDWYKKNFNK